MSNGIWDATYNPEPSELETKVTSYEARIAELEAENALEKKRNRELEAENLSFARECNLVADEKKELKEENQRLRDKALKIGKAFMADPPFDTYHGIDIHETASDYAEWDGRTGEILPMDYFDALVRCCKESQALLGGGECTTTK